VQTILILLPSPLLDDDLGFLQSAKDFTVEHLIAKLAVEALNVTVLPRTARLDEQGLERQLVELGSDLIVREF
jgi:hypothetical protein